MPPGSLAAFQGHPMVPRSHGRGSFSVVRSGLTSVVTICWVCILATRQLGSPLRYCDHQQLVFESALSTSIRVANINYPTLMHPLAGATTAGPHRIQVEHWAAGCSSHEQQRSWRAACALDTRYARGCSRSRRSQGCWRGLGPAGGSAAPKCWQALGPEARDGA